MAKSDDKPSIIIIKRIEEAHEGHHGGSWKVAYADFVTAMMAFFLLLWLLGATTETQRKGIADYFDASLTVSQNTSGANGVLGGKTIAEPGAQTSASATYDPTKNSLPAQPTPVSDEDDFSKAPDNASQEASEAEIRRQDEQHFAESEKALRQAITNDPSLADLANNLAIDRTPEGLRIQLVDQANYSMFDLGSAQMPPRTRELIGLVAKAVVNLPNKLSVQGHTDARPYTNAAGDNWRLSSDRALTTRSALIDGGLDAGRIKNVVGMAETDPFIAADPLDPRNRRMSIILLYGKAAAKAPAGPPPTDSPPTAKP
jgi:chemotaxis protein MotB